MERAPSPPASPRDEALPFSPDLFSLPSLPVSPEAGTSTMDAFRLEGLTGRELADAHASALGIDETNWPYVVHELLGTQETRDILDRREECEEEDLCEDEDDRPSGREARKRAEKNRRTNLSRLVAELSALLPSVRNSPRKIDKIGVLRLAAHEIRKEHIFGDTVNRSPFGAPAAEAFLRLFRGFFLSLTIHGIVVIASPNIQQILGHAEIDLLGSNVYPLVHPDDARILHLNLTTAKKGDLRDFIIRIARASARCEPPRYAYCRLRGGFRQADRAGQWNVEGRQLPRRQRVRRDHVTNPSGNDLIIIALGQVVEDPPLSARLVEASKQEYWTRHLIDGRIVHCDQRISLVAGYMCEEVVGVSAFTFMHKEDVRWVIIALRQMYDQSQPYGESCYRLASRTGQFMYLRTRGYLEIDPVTKEAQSFVCINSLITDEEGARLINEMKRKYSAIVNMDTDDSSFFNREQGDCGLEDPGELEHVIMCLIDKLPSSNTNSPQCSPASVTEKENLTIIPPEPRTIKPSIEKSITVVNKRSRKRVAPVTNENPQKKLNIEQSANKGD